MTNPPVTGEAVEPFAYAYRYPTFPPKGATVIRFGTQGREINGAKPIETIPLYTLAALTKSPPSVSDAMPQSSRVDGECNILDKTIQVCPRHGHSHSHLYSPPAQLEALAYAYEQGFRWPERFGIDRKALSQSTKQRD